ncbi:MAG: DUF4982 domain-containing protein [Bacteroidales bacterium]|nr:DUF4982 domain-containing protein [Bacteroidales bacterium]
MKKYFVTILTLLLCVGLYAEDFNEGWTFWFDGHEKETIRLPHDAMIHMPRSADVPSGSSIAFYHGGLFHYEKTFDVTAEMLSKHVTFNFECVYMNSKVYINGQLAGGIPYGYSQFSVCADGLLKEGKNTILVDSDNSKMQDSRWYSGAGIYRPVEMVVQDPIHIETVHVSTLSIAPKAKLLVETKHVGGKPRVEILYGDKVVAKGKGKSAKIKVKNPKLWNAEHPDLYTVKVSLKNKNQITDVYTSTFGIRTLEWSTKGFFVNGENVLLKGGCLHADNGILGMAEYDDAAARKISILKEYGHNAVGSAHQPRSEAMLKACDEQGMYVMDELWDMWFSPKNANDYGNWFMDNYHNDITAIVEKDFNHPCVVMYSIGNEVNDPKTEEGMRVAHDIVASLHAIDASRPTTMGVNLAFLGPRGMRGLFGGPSDDKKDEPAKEEDDQYGGNVSLRFNEAVQASAGKIGEAVLTHEIDSATTPILDALDIAGYNYAVARYPIEKDYHPDRIVVGSETYPPDIYTTWQLVKELPYVIGDFMWTAWDYLGEVGAGAWTYEGEGTGFTKTYPWKLANSGSIDILGNPTGETYLSKITWEENPGSCYLAVRPVRKDPVVSRSIWRSSNSIPSWSWKGCEGIPAVVEIYSLAEKVELYLNGKKLDEGTPENGLIMFQFPYEPGKLEAKAYIGGELTGTSVLESATGNINIAVRPEKETIGVGNLAYVNINLEGENGVVEAHADSQLSVKVEGGELLGYGSARAISTDIYDSGSHLTYYGKTQAIILATNLGTIKVTASGAGYKDATATVTVK